MHHTHVTMRPEQWLNVVNGFLWNRLEKHVSIAKNGRAHGPRNATGLNQNKTNDWKKQTGSQKNRLDRTGCMTKSGKNTKNVQNMSLLSQMLAISPNSGFPFSAPLRAVSEQPF